MDAQLADEVRRIKNVLYFMTLLTLIDLVYVLSSPRLDDTSSFLLPVSVLMVFGAIAFEFLACATTCRKGEALSGVNAQAVIGCRGTTARARCAEGEDQ